MGVRQTQTNIGEIDVFVVLSDTHSISKSK